MALPLVRILAFLALFTWTTSMATAGDPPKGLPLNPSRLEILDHLIKLEPAERFRLLSKVLDKDKDFQAAERGEVTNTVLERGTLQAVQTSDVICRVRTVGKGSTVAATIKWVIDDGTLVKKGDTLIEFDDSAHVEQLKTQRNLVAKAANDQKRATEYLERIKRENQIDIKLGQIEVRLAELNLKQFKGDDATQKEILALHVDRAALSVERIKTRAAVTESEAADDLQLKKSIHEQERDRQLELEKDIRNCVLTAPQDGMAMYYVSEGRGFGAGGSTTAQGEPVREGQKLLTISDLKRMLVVARVHEAWVAKIRAGQKVLVRVDAFPGKIFAGEVKVIAAVADQAEFFSSDVKVFSVTIPLAGEQKDLRPGMSAEVTITIAEKLDCLRVPAPAVLGQGKEKYCYVLNGKELHARKLTVGLANNKFAEVTNGLKEGESVLRSPNAVAGRLADALQFNEKPVTPRLKPTQIRLRSVKPADEDAQRRSFVRKFGLTHEDYERIAALDEVAQIIAARSFPVEVRRMERLHFGQLVATTADYPEAHGLKLARGRFLSTEDEDQSRNVVVLGAEVADELFAGAEALGESVVMNKQLYDVVGIMRETRPSGIEARKIDDAVFIPLRTCKQRFGEKVYFRQGGSRTGEEVQLHEILVTVHDATRIRSASLAISNLLRIAHPNRDWDMQVGSRSAPVPK